MELELNKNVGEIRLSESLISQLPESRQHAFKIIVQQIIEVKEE